MSTFHSLINNLIAAATIYGWRIDAVAMSALLWAMTASYTQVLSPSLSLARRSS
jgi:hypothetical protein